MTNSKQGGGYAAGGRYSYSAFMLDLAQRLPDCIILLVEYGLAPYVQFPVPIHQTAAVIDFLCISTPHVRFALAGDSAGGGLVASSLLHIREENNALWMDRMVGAVMISPMLSQEHSDVPGMENQQFDIIQSRLAHSTAKNYCPIPEVAKHNTLASPVFENDLFTGLPPMLTTTVHWRCLLTIALLLANVPPSRARVLKSRGLRAWYTVSSCWRRIASRPTSRCKKSQIFFMQDLNKVLNYSLSLSAKSGFTLETLSICVSTQSSSSWRTARTNEAKPCCSS